MDDKKVTGHLASAGAYIIFGLNIVFCKDIANASVISPEALFGIRMVCAAALFWVLSLFLPKEKMSGKDLALTAAAAMIGLVTPQYTFLKGITMTTSIESSILGSLGPVFTMIFAAIFLKEPISGKKALGVGMSLAGVLILIFGSMAIGSQRTDGSSPAGIALLLMNSLSFALYLGIFRPLIQKYSVVTFMKWMFLFCLMVALPVSLGPVIAIDCSQLSPRLLGETAYLVFFATFVAYFLIPIGQQRLRPTLVSMYSYLQPVIAVAISILSGIDRLSPMKVAAIILVFTGVAVVNKSRSAQ
ncbi:MAG: DMT family transporter [Candidatus Cryptobacteroides sp.]